ncbi:MAG: stress responsive protein [Rhizobiales bacterium 65-9]|nr:Dabb family protein [Hyphomicrobiales bacterium]OJY36803.1 MAG: stress responsive protein [Rhizobiales bacterium 65-9]
MIRHVVLFSAKDKTDIERIIDGLSVLARIPNARRLEVARNARIDQIDNSVDVIVYGEFDDEAEFAAYKAHPLYEESIRRVRPIRELRIAADYDTAGAVPKPGG